MYNDLKKCILKFMVVIVIEDKIYMQCVKSRNEEIKNWVYFNCLSQR